MNKFNQRIVFMGTPAFAANVLEGIINAGYNVVAVVTQPDKEVGRKHDLKASEVKTMALKYNLPVLTPKKVRLEYEPILAYEPDLIISSAYGQIIPSALLDYPKYKCINTHGSLLPKYRGGAPIQRSIINGDKQTGITIMYMNEKMDEGDILSQSTIDIDTHDTNTTLFDKLSNLALEMLIDFLPNLFEGNINPIKQNSLEATYAYNLDKDIEHILFNEDVTNVHNHIRGLLDNPGCYCVIKDKKYKIEKVDFEINENVEPSIFKGLENNYLRLDCNNGFIKVYTIKPEGKNSMDAKSFYNGVGRNLVGEKLG